MSVKACRRRSCAAVGLELWGLGKCLRLESQVSGIKERILGLTATRKLAHKLIYSPSFYKES